MTAKEFNLIESIDEKAELIWDCGNYIDERINYGKQIIKTYSVYNFYVDVFLNAKDYHIEEIKAYEDEKDFAGYLNSIKIKDLY